MHTTVADQSVQEKHNTLQIKGVWEDEWVDEEEGEGHKASPTPNFIHVCIHEKEQSTGREVPG